MTSLFVIGLGIRPLALRTRPMSPLPDLGETIAATQKARGHTPTELARMGEPGFAKVGRILAALGLRLEIGPLVPRRPPLAEWLEEDRRGKRGAAFATASGIPDARSVSVTMSVRLESWNLPFGLHPIFEMNLPEELHSWGTYPVLLA